MITMKVPRTPYRLIPERADRSISRFVYLGAFLSFSLLFLLVLHPVMYWHADDDAEVNCTACSISKIGSAFGPVDSPALTPFFFAICLPFPPLNDAMPTTANVSSTTRPRSPPR